MKKEFKINCLFCEKAHKTFKKQTRFCSISCGSRWNHKNNINFLNSTKLFRLRPKQPRIDKICQLCSGAYSVSKSRQNKTKYCSAKCNSTANYNANKIVMIENARKACKGRVAPNRGISHSRMALEKIIKHSLLRPNGYWSVRYFPYVDKLGRKHALKSSYEIAFVKDYLDQLNIHWEYEPNIFYLPNGKAYVPDFYAREYNTFYEVKGYKQHESMKKFELFKKAYPNINIVLMDKENLIQCGVDISTNGVKDIMNKWRDNGTKKKEINNPG